MRVGPLVVTASLTAFTLLGCGGSSSETPWPAEPEGKTLGPSGETAPSDLEDARSRKRDGDAGAAPDNVEP
jgi:hypothetical protein